jgi:sugar lactone lactonase YvrE
VRRTAVMLALAAALAAPAALAKTSYPDVIPLPNGWQPEGIATGTGSTFYVGSIPTGAVFAGNLRTGTGRTLVQPATGHAATGLKHSRGHLWVSGASTGKAFVYNARTGALVRELQLASGSGGTFINDVVVTKNAAYFTDSMRPVIYRVPVSKRGVPGEAATAVSLSGDYQHVSGFNLNGIDAVASGKTLLAIQSATGKLFAINPTTGATKAVDLGGATLTNGDGILLAGRTLYVVQNRDNKIAVVSLQRDLSRGSIAKTLTDSDLDVPTTIARFGNRLYAINARFGATPGPDTPYSVVQLRR